MATKREMAERVKVLSAELGIFTPTAGLNHPALEAVLVELEAKAAAAAAEKAKNPDGAAAGAQDGTPEPPPSIASGRYRVGRAALTSPRGILIPGKMLRPGDVTPEALQQLLRAKLVIDTEAPSADPAPQPLQQEVSDGPAGTGGG